MRYLVFAIMIIIVVGIIFAQEYAYSQDYVIRAYEISSPVELGYDNSGGLVVTIPQSNNVAIEFPTPLTIDVPTTDGRFELPSSNHNVVVSFPSGGTISLPPTECQQHGKKPSIHTISVRGEGVDIRLRK